jgi:hypothetical protein
VGEDGGVGARGEKLMVRLAGDDDFCACLDNRFDFLQCEPAVASHENITEAETLGAHRRIIYESENMMGRDFECVDSRPRM